MLSVTIFAKTGCKIRLSFYPRTDNWTGMWHGLNVTYQNNTFSTTGSYQDFDTFCAFHRTVIMLILYRDNAIRQLHIFVRFVYVNKGYPFHSLWISSMGITTVGKSILRCYISKNISTHFTSWSTWSIICIDSFTVSLHSPNGRHLPAVSAVQGDCQELFKVFAVKILAWDRDALQVAPIQCM